MAKKFFYNKVYNTKRTIINVVIIGACILGIVLCFIFVSRFKGESHEKKLTYDLNTAGVTIEVNEEYTNAIFLTRINDDTDLTKIHVKYPSNFDITKSGVYDVKITIDGDEANKEYSIPLTVIDIVKPDLVTKQLTIKEKEQYIATQFVESCTDNSTHDCHIDFYKDGTDEDGNIVNYEEYTDVGTYPIKIVATDDDGNENVQETMLIIESDSTTTPDDPGNPDDPNTPDTPSIPEPVCKYGSNEYDTDEYVLTTDITTNGCALSLDLYQDAIDYYEDNLSKKTLRKVIDNEILRIKKDVEALNLIGILRLEQHITVVLNDTGRGLVGYQLNIIVTKEDSNHNIEKIANYKLSHSGKRIYTENPYNLPE